MAKAIGLSNVDAKPYILDIDLDYFHSEKSINPTDTTAFYRLIRNSVAVTIATEPECVEYLRLDGSAVTAPMLLDRLKEHIKAAMMADARTLSK
jgi:hypothetical protein